jgi:hypothetical protein
MFTIINPNTAIANLTFQKAVISFTALVSSSGVVLGEKPKEAGKYLLE